MNTNPPAGSAPEGISRTGVSPYTVPSGRQFLQSLWAWPVAGLGVLLALSAFHLWQHTWDQEAYSHGPIVLGILLWLVWAQPAPPAIEATRLERLVGCLLLIVGASAYVIGRSQSLTPLEVAGLIPMACGMLLLVGGRQALTHYGFVLLFACFLIPLPAFLIDLVTNPLKLAVSQCAEEILYRFDYPISREGVILGIGKYQLLVADACSGMNSLFSLSAMGLLFLKLSGPRSPVRNGLVAAMIIPIAFAANLVRVMALVLLTYYFGDEVGQGFLHGFAGITLFLIALLSLFAFDKLLGLLMAPRTGGSLQP